MGNDFAADVRKFTLKTGIKLDDFVRNVTFELFKAVVIATPADTSYAKANWQIGIDFRPSGVIDALDELGQQAIARATAMLLQIKAGGTNYITNNCSYIIPLEYGHSDQAPSGMARINVIRWQEYVDNVMRTLR